MNFLRFLNFAITLSGHMATARNQESGSEVISAIARPLLAAS